MKKRLTICLLSASLTAAASTQSTSTYTNINFHLDNYVNIEILNKRVYMMLERKKKYPSNEHILEVPIKLDWVTQKGVSFTASCTSPTNSDLCKDNGLVKFPFIDMTGFKEDIYREGKQQTYLVTGAKNRYKGDHFIEIGVSDVSEFIDDYGKNKESIFLYKIHIEARI